ncbi:hypothetical protein NL676_035029 [Syzygium grande]|nr:hypothetical protein NL676_035029 [Syzygium grande]
MTSGRGWQRTHRYTKLVSTDSNVSTAQGNSGKGAIVARWQTLGAVVVAPMMLSVKCSLGAAAMASQAKAAIGAGRDWIGVVVGWRARREQRRARVAARRHTLHKDCGSEVERLPREVEGGDGDSINEKAMIPRCCSCSDKTLISSSFGLMMGDEVTMVRATYTCIYPVELKQVRNLTQCKGYYARRFGPKAIGTCVSLTYYAFDAIELQIWNVAFDKGEYEDSAAISIKASWSSINLLQWKWSVLESLSTKAKDPEDKGRTINMEIEMIEKEILCFSLRLVAGHW